MHLWEKIKELSHNFHNKFSSSCRLTNWSKFERHFCDFSFWEGESVQNPQNKCIFALPDTWTQNSQTKSSTYLKIVDKITLWTTKQLSGVIKQYPIVHSHSRNHGHSEESLQTFFWIGDECRSSLYKSNNQRGRSNKSWKRYRATKSEWVPTPSVAAQERTTLHFLSRISRSERFFFTRNQFFMQAFLSDLCLCAQMEHPSLMC